MSDTELDALLIQLREALSDTGELSAATKTLMQTVSDDISAALDKASIENDDADSEQGIGSDSLRKMAIEFEAEHPRLAHTINDLADSLAKIGI